MSNYLKILPYVLISLLGGAIVPLQLAIVNAFRESTQASQIQSTFYLYLGGALASLVLSYVMSGGLKPPMVENATWWMWLPGFLGSFYILFMFIAAPKIKDRRREYLTMGVFRANVFCLDSKPNGLVWLRG